MAATHLHIDWLRPLTGRIVCLPVLSFAELSADETERAAVQSLLSNFIDATGASDAETNPRWKGRLDEAWARLALLVPAWLDTAAGKGKSADARNAGVEIARLLTDSPCSRCTKENPCDGRDPRRDSKLVASPGVCIAPLHDLFNWAQKTTLAWYGKYASGFSKLSLPAIELSTSLLLQAPFDFAPDFHVSGEVRYEKNGESPISRVEMKFHVDGFGLKCHRSLPYILLHELVVHAFQGIGQPANHRREEAPAEDWFSEGWMDRAALLITEQEMLGCGLVSPPPAMHPPEYDLCDELHTARVSRPKRSKADATARHHGNLAASMLLTEMGKRLPDRDAAFQSFLELSLGLNLIFDGSGVYDAIAKKMYESWALNLPTGREQLLQKNQLSQRLNQYLDSGNVSDFVKPFPG